MTEEQRNQDYFRKYANTVILLALAKSVSDKLLSRVLPPTGPGEDVLALVSLPFDASWIRPCEHWQAIAMNR